MLSACSSGPDIAGKWQAKNPGDVTLSLPQAALATSLTTIEFQKDQSKSEGPVTFTNSYDITPAGGTAAVTATASATGHWETDVDDQDDLVISYDMASIKVDVAGDSAAVAIWRPEVERLFRADLSRYGVMEDVEIDRSRSLMSLELNNPEQKVYFSKVGS